MLHRNWESSVGAVNMMEVFVTFLKWAFVKMGQKQGPRREGQTETALMLCKLNKSL